MSAARRVGSWRAALCIVVLGGVLLGPVSGAAARDAIFKAVIQSEDQKILVAEGHVVTALGEYKKSGNPRGTQAALQKSIDVLSSLRSKIASQSASSKRVKLGKAKFEQGLQSVVRAYRHLEKALGEKKVSPRAAKAEARKAVSAVKAGAKELREGAKLLK